MSYTVHYINNDWELKVVCLQASFAPEDHTGENIKLLSKCKFNLIAVLYGLWKAL